MSEKDHVPFGLCPYCDRFVPDFLSHYFFQPGKFRTPCKECTLVISNPFCVKRHEKIVHNIDDDVEEVFKSETENDDPSILTCDVDIGDDDVCGIEFKKERNLNRHKNFVIILTKVPNLVQSGLEKLISQLCLGLKSLPMKPLERRIS